VDPGLAQGKPLCLLAEGLAGAGDGFSVPALLLGQGRDGNCILALGQAALDAGASRLALPGLWLCPAPLDAHVHLHLGGAVAYNLERSRAAGLAAVRDLGHSPAKPTPRSPGGGPPWVIASGPGLGGVGPGASWLAEKLSGPEAFGRAAEERARAGAGVIKVFATGLLDFERPGEVLHDEAVSQAELGAAVQAAEGAGLPVAVHASGVDAVGRALAAGVSSVEHGFFLDRATLTTMAGQGTFWVPTCAAVLAHADDPEGRHPPELRERLRAIYDGQLMTLAMAEALGVPLALGTDAGSYGLEHGQAVFAEMECWLAAGLRPATVFRAATQGAAKLLGLAGKVGSLAVGAQAWLLGVPGDPARDPLLMARPPWRSF
jgi:imidazolonepropionase-like amidohydrolase